MWLAGEISNFSRAASGHLYFTLKDAGAALSCVMWRSAAGRLTWQPEQGMPPWPTGTSRSMRHGGRYQLYVDQLRPAGLGDLHARFEELRDRLKARGCLMTERKRPLPPFPRVLGIVTSPQAAALRDVSTCCTAATRWCGCCWRPPWSRATRPRPRLSPRCEPWMPATTWT